MHIEKFMQLTLSVYASAGSRDANRCHGIVDQ